MIIRTDGEEGDGGGGLRTRYRFFFEIGGNQSDDLYLQTSACKQKPSRSRHLPVKVRTNLVPATMSRCHVIRREIVLQTWLSPSISGLFLKETEMAINRSVNKMTDQIIKGAKQKKNTSIADKRLRFPG